MQSLKINLMSSVKEATARGFTSEALYKGSTGIKLTEAVVVKGGTELNKPTVDLIFEDIKGNKFVALVTASLLSQVCNVAKSTDTPEGE